MRREVRVFDLVAYLDESKKPMRDMATGRPSGKGEHYVVAAAVVIEGDSATIREAIVSIEARLGYRLHYADLRSRERRLAAIEELDRIPGWDGYLFETARPLPASGYSEHHIRAKTLTVAFTVLGVDVGVTRVILETRAAPKRGFTRLDENDRGVWQKLVTNKEVPADLRMDHADKTEPILAVVDILAGARSDFLCLSDQEAYPLIAHRIRSIHTLFRLVP